MSKSMQSLNDLDRSLENARSLSDKLVKFAHVMKTIPRKVVKDDLYDGVVYIVVDNKQALKIFQAAFPGYNVTHAVCYEAFNVLQSLLEERQY